MTGGFSDEGSHSPGGGGAEQPQRLALGRRNQEHLEVRRSMVFRGFKGPALGPLLMFFSFLPGCFGYLVDPSQLEERCSEVGFSGNETFSGAIGWTFSQT